jgi:magnesium-transporting ATPase (P-type)
MCQQRFTRHHYDRMIEQYKEEKRSQSSTNTEDLNGFPSNDCCFIGLFTLLDPSRSEVSDAVLKARRAQIRVAMVTGDHPTMAKAIAKQVHILTPEISEVNGIDTFKIAKDANGYMVINMYRNKQLLNQYIPSQMARFNPNKENHSSSIDVNEAQSDQKSSWYKRAWTSCRNQFSEPKSDVQKATKMEYIPYGIVVSLSYLIDLVQTFSNEQVSGADIGFMDDFLWDWVLSHQELVFARISPEQKLRIVSEFQRRAEIVAVTGDGAKDAPALKCADLGVAIQSGTEVSKEAADVILLDNSFASIIQAIETGRLLSDNLKKVAIYLLPGGKDILMEVFKRIILSKS